MLNLLKKEVPSYNLPGYEEIGQMIIEEARKGKYDMIVPLNDDDLYKYARDRFFLVEKYYLKHSSKYQKLHRKLKGKGYSHRIIEPGPEDYHTGLFLYISWR